MVSGKIYWTETSKYSVLFSLILQMTDLCLAISKEMALGWTGPGRKCCGLDLSLVLVAWYWTLIWYLICPVRPSLEWGDMWKISALGSNSIRGSLSGHRHPRLEPCVICHCGCWGEVGMCFPFCSFTIGCLLCLRQRKRKFLRRPFRPRCCRPRWQITWSVTFWRPNWRTPLVWVPRYVGQMLLQYRVSGFPQCHPGGQWHSAHQGPVRRQEPPLGMGAWILLFF